MDSERIKEVMFPHDSVRPIQDDLIKAVDDSLLKKKHLVVHAPTGLGKTAASLGPAIAHAIKNDLTVFFLTSRHTQHKIALETIRAVENKYNTKIKVANLIGKKWMCLQGGVESMYSGEFVDYCRKLREDKKCTYYENLKKNGSLSTDAKLALEKSQENPSSRHLKVLGQEFNVCPYEIGILAAKNAKVIVTDYFYVFNPGIRETFFTKISKELESSIIIVDEAHNLPGRVKDLASERVSSRIIERAISEAEKWDQDFPVLELLSDALIQLASQTDDDGEKYVSKDELLDLIGDFDVDEMIEIGDEIREETKRSYIGSVGNFLKAWLSGDDGFTRILTKGDDYIVLSYRCLDPGVVTGSIIGESYSTILMSGTLTPTVMYAELLDVPLRCSEFTLQSPFPEDNRLTMIVPRTTTKFTARSEEMFKLQAELLTKMADSVPGNSIIFFPSYSLRNKIAAFITTKKEVLNEEPGLSKEERESLLKTFISKKEKGAVLLAVMGASFGEGVDLPGDLLKAVFVVGLPLARPDKETNALINYYNEKFKRGWDYGYVFPAFNKILQSAGRCIRSETDRGVIVFLDERYSWPTYQKCFPPHWDLQISNQGTDMIKHFFGINTESQSKL